MQTYLGMYSSLPGYVQVLDHFHQLDQEPKISTAFPEFHSRFWRI